MLRDPSNARTDKRYQPKSVPQWTSHEWAEANKVRATSQGGYKPVNTGLLNERRRCYTNVKISLRNTSDGGRVDVARPRVASLTHEDSESKGHTLRRHVGAHCLGKLEKAKL